MTAGNDNDVAVLLHLSTLDHWQEFVRALERVETPFDLKVNLVRGLNDGNALLRQKQIIKAAFPDSEVIDSENRGMDVGGMFRLFSLVRDRGHRALLYAHSKSDAAWRGAMLDTLTRNSRKALALLLDRDAGSRTRPAGMVGAGLYPFDYYNIGPFMTLAAELGIEPVTSWERYFRRYPASRELPVDQRVAHAAAMNKPELRPEVDLDYAGCVLGDINRREQPMSRALLARMAAERVIGPLPYFPGNCFWIGAEVVRRLGRRIDFDQEHAALPLNLTSDRAWQSRAHAWERMLPVFALKNGFRLVALNSGAGGHP